MGFISSTIIEFIATEAIERGALKVSKLFSKRGKEREEEPARSQPDTHAPTVKQDPDSAEDELETLDADDTVR